jgi:hypothetical protein
VRDDDSDAAVPADRILSGSQGAVPRPRKRVRDDDSDAESSSEVDERRCGASTGAVWGPYLKFGAGACVACSSFLVAS